MGRTRTAGLVVLANEARPVPREATRLVSAYCFGEFVLDCGTRELRRAGETVHLSPKAFQLLQILVEAAPRAMSKAELQDRLWPDTFVIEANLQHLIVEIRSSLGDDPHDPHYIRTVHGFGYAFKEEPAKVGARSAGQFRMMVWVGSMAPAAATRTRKRWPSPVTA